MSPVSETGTSRGVCRVSALASSSGRVNLLLFVLALTFVITIATNEPSLIQPHKLQKRDVVQLCNLINRYTGRNCLDYTNYGCHCRLGRFSQVPVDAIDRCCKAFKSCYDPFFHPCSLTTNLPNYNIHCGVGALCSCPSPPFNSVCQFNTCQCDLTFAQCIQNTDYNQRFEGFCPS